MKKLILLNAFIILLLTPVFSQTVGHFKIDTTFRDRSIFRFQKPFNLSDTIHFNHPFSGSLNHKYLLFPGFSERNFFNKQIPIDNLVEMQSYDKMPCFKPSGNFPMPVAKPDSTIRYSILIKRY